MSKPEMENLSDLLQKWYEGQKPGNNNNVPSVGPEVDVISLTWLLKEIGFKLDYLNFDAIQLGLMKQSSVTIEIKCNVSGMVARLSCDSSTCVCPSKKEESSFWEVQTASPAEIYVKKETSSSFLPEVSEKCSLLSKAILANLLNYYKESIAKGDKKCEIGKIRIPEKFNTPPQKSIGNQVGDKESELTEQYEMHDEDKTSEITIKSSAATDEKKTVENVTVNIEYGIQQNQDATSNTSLGSIHLDAENLVTSSPKRIQETNIRNNNVVQALNDARAKIDQALLFMNFNITQDISLSSSHLLTNTPEFKRRSVGIPSSGSSNFGSVKRSATLTQITGHQLAVNNVKEENSKLVRSNTFSRKSGIATPIMGTSALSRSNSLRIDTPRPKLKPSPNNSVSIGQANNSGRKSLKAMTNLSSSSSSISSLNSAASGSTSSKAKSLPGTKKNFDIKRPTLIERFHKQFPAPNTPKKG